MCVIIMIKKERCYIHFDKGISPYLVLQKNCSWELVFPKKYMWVLGVWISNDISQNAADETKKIYYFEKMNLISIA